MWLSCYCSLTSINSTTLAFYQKLKKFLDSSKKQLTTEIASYITSFKTVKKCTKKTFNHLDMDERQLPHCLQTVQTASCFQSFILFNLKKIKKTKKN